MTLGKKLAVLLVAILVISGAAPVLAFDERSHSAGASVQQTADNASNVSVTVGAQLSTVMSTTGDSLQTEFDDEVFEHQLDETDASKQARIVAQRIERLDTRAQTVRTEYDRVTAQYEAGDLTRSQYAQRLAMLNARAENVLRSIEQTEARLEQISNLELSAAGVNRSTLSGAAAILEPLTGPGATALHQRFVGEGNGEVHVETDNGLTIRVGTNETDHSRTTKRPRDDDNGVTISQREALDVARNALRGPADGWHLTKSSIHDDRGYYRFEFTLETQGATGTATVRIDASTGSVFSVDESFKRSENAKDNETEHDELSLVVAGGTTAPNQNVTVQAFLNGQAAADVVITVNGERVGTTDADGKLTLMLPAGDVSVKGVRGETASELEFDFTEQNTDQRESVFRDLDARATVENDVATVTVTYNDKPVPGALVFAEGTEVGRTNADGTVQFETPATETLDIEVAKGQFGAAFSFTIENGTGVLDGGARESDKTDTRDTSENDTRDPDTKETPTGNETDEGTDTPTTELPPGQDTVTDNPLDENVTDDPLDGNVTQDPIDGNVTRDPTENITDGNVTTTVNDTELTGTVIETVTDNATNSSVTA